MSGTGRLSITIEEVVKLCQLQLDGGDGGIHLRSPFGEGFVECCSRLLQVGDAHITNLLCRSHLVEALGEGCLMHREPILDLGTDLLRQFVEHQLDVGVHGTEDVLLAARVVEWVQRGLER
jgi:hypothetical protein